MHAINILNKNTVFSLVSVILLSLCSACSHKAAPQNAMAEQKKPASYEVNDYLEPVNRSIFKVNEVIDGVLIKPLAHIYRGIIPEFGQKGIKNALINLTQPVVFINSLLQWDTDNAGKSVSRFAINSTAGILGFIDVASEVGIEKERRKDFGQTMGVYGAGTGTYIVLPLLGPSDARDTLGLIVDTLMDPFSYIFTTPESLARAGISAISTRADYLKVTDQIYRDSLDPYATFRSIYLQNRAKTVRDYLGTPKSENANVTR